MIILFAERIKELRSKANLTQTQLANELGFTQRKISYWECGKVQPDLNTLLQVAVYFKVSTDYMIGYKPK